MLKSVLVILSFCFVAFGAVGQSVVIEASAKDLLSQPTLKTEVIRIGADMVEIETTGEGLHQTLYFDRDSKQVIKVNHVSKTVTTYSSSWVEKQRERNRVRQEMLEAKFKKRLAKMVPREQERFRESMNMKGGQGDNLSYTATKEQSQILDWNSTLYYGFKEEEKRQECYVIPINDVSEGDEMLAFMELKNHLGGLWEDQATTLNVCMTINEQEDLLALRRVFFFEGQVKSAYEITSFMKSEESLVPFSMPEGYTNVAAPEGLDY